MSPGSARLHHYLPSHLQVHNFLARHKFSVADNLIVGVRAWRTHDFFAVCFVCDFAHISMVVGWNWQRPSAISMCGCIPPKLPP